jgi:hypothetical protein
MTQSIQTRSNPAELIEAAARQLVSVSNWGRDWFIALPLYYPGGGTVTVKIEPASTAFMVSDNGFAFREVESLGAERSFYKTAARIAGEEGVQVSRRVFSLAAAPDQLAVYISKVAVSSWRTAHHICEKVSAREEVVIAEDLYSRLIEIFGVRRVRPEGVTLIGLSTSLWEVSAVVEAEDHTIVFDAVAKHRNSIYRTATKFHDLAATDNPPRLVAVVRDKQELGAGLALLAQAGMVIEEGQSNDVFQRAAA